MEVTTTDTDTQIGNYKFIGARYKKYHVTMEEYNNQFKITCQHCNGFVTCFDRSVEILYITFLHSVISTIVLYPEDLVTENFYLQLLEINKMQCMYQSIFK